MLEFLANWGIELILGLLATAISGGVIWYIKKLKAQIKLGEEYTKEQEKDQIEENIEDKTKPLYDELENLRSYVRDNEIKSNKMWALVIDSYKFRLIELCKIHISFIWSLCSSHKKKRADVYFLTLPLPRSLHIIFHLL